MFDHPEQADELVQYKAHLKALKFHEYKVATDRVEESWKQVKMAMEKEPKSSWMRFVLKTAAVIVFLSAAAFVVNFIVNTNDSSVKGVANVNYISKQAEPGIKLTVQLPDGSKIKLNSGSKLIYPDTFTDNKREVQLIGEAYFDIARDENRPFSIKTDDLVTTVLGTKFTINAYYRDHIQVSLISGSVQVDNFSGNNTNPINSLLLVPGEKAVFQNDQLSKEVVDNLLDIGWKDDIIAFNNSDIDEITAKLSNWYGVDFDIENKKSVIKSFNGVYQNEVMENVLKSIAHAMDFTYHINGKKVIIKGN